MFLTGVATGTLVPSTSEDKPPTPVPALTPPTLSDAYDPHDYDEVTEDVAAQRSSGLTNSVSRSCDRSRDRSCDAYLHVYTIHIYGEEDPVIKSYSLSLSLPQRVPGPRTGENNLVYDEISMEGARTKIMGGGLIVAPSDKKEGEGEEGGEGGRVKDLERKLLKVMREKEKLSKSNTTLQRNVTELQKQV